MKAFENRKIKGAVSIFLIMILIPTLLFSAVLVDASRLASARAMTQEAADLAAASALAAYNMDLKEDYGLFAMEDASKAEEIYRESLNATLLASGLQGEEGYSEQLWELMKSAMGAASPYQGKEFANLYDFRVESCSVTPEYSLGEWQVLENQMVEYAKFRGIYVMADRLGILGSLGEAKEQADQNQATAEAMEEKMDVDEENMSADQALEKLRQATGDLNTAMQSAGISQESYFKALSSRMDQLKEEYTDAEAETDQEWAGRYESSQKGLIASFQVLPKMGEEVRRQAEQAKKEVNASIGRLEKFVSGNQEKGEGNSDISQLVKEAEDNIGQYKSVYLPQIDAILEDEALKALAGHSKVGTELKRVLDKIDEGICRYGEELEEEQEEENESEDGREDEAEDGEAEEEDSYYYYYLTGGERTEEKAQVLEGGSGCYQPAVRAVTDAYRGRMWKEINPTLEVSQKQEEAAGKIDRDFAKEQSGSQESPENEDASEERGEVPEEIYQMRPSKTFESEGSAPAGNDFYNESGDLSASKEIIGKGAQGSMIQDLAETARDDVLCLSYMFGTFKTRLSGVEKFSKNGMSQEDKNSFYMPKWRYANEEGELDMRLSPKKDRETILRGEIEYLVYGNRTDKANEDGVYATIFAERLANNVVAVYGDKEIRGACHGAAAAASAATMGIVPEPVFFWIFLIAWATAETAVDMDFLVQGGYRIPLIKTSKNLVLDLDGSSSINGYGKKGIFVTYEDYLMILLLLKGQEKRLMRSADLIEMNMKTKQPEFSIAEAYTYLHGTSQMSLRYMFGGLAPFEQAYQAGGAVGRMGFSSEIYLGY